MHTAEHVRFKISQLRQDKVIFAVEAIAVFLFALFISVFLPNLLLRYVYTDPTMAELPKVFDYIPVFSFGLGTMYFLFATIGNFAHMAQIRKLEAELEKLAAQGCDDCCCGGECSGDCGEDCCSPNGIAGHSHTEMASPKVKTDSSSESLGLLAEKMKSTKKRGKN